MSAAKGGQQSSQDEVTAHSLAEHRMYVLFYSIVGMAAHGRGEMVCEECMVDSARWLYLTSGGWVRDRDPGFMERRWPGNPGATGYYGWHPSKLVSEKVIAAAEDNWTVPVNIGWGGWRSGYSYVSHPDRRWAALHLLRVALILLLVLLFMRDTIIKGCRQLMG